MKDQQASCGKERSTGQLKLRLEESTHNPVNLVGFGSIPSRLHAEPVLGITPVHEALNLATLGVDPAQELCAPRSWRLTAVRQGLQGGPADEARPNIENARCKGRGFVNRQRYIDALLDVSGGSRDVLLEPLLALIFVVVATQHHLGPDMSGAGRRNAYNVLVCHRLTTLPWLHKRHGRRDHCRQGATDDLRA